MLKMLLLSDWTCTSVLALPEAYISLHIYKTLKIKAFHRKRGNVEKSTADSTGSKSEVFCVNI
jgi:hypothetical protein